MMPDGAVGKGQQASADDVTVTVSKDLDDLMLELKSWKAEHEKSVIYIVITNHAPLTPVPFMYGVGDIIR